MTYVTFASPEEVTNAVAIGSITSKTAASILAALTTERPVNRGVSFMALIPHGPPCGSRRQRRLTATKRLQAARRGAK